MEDLPKLMSAMSFPNLNAVPFTPDPTPTPAPIPPTGVRPRRPSARGSNHEIGYVTQAENTTGRLRSYKGSVGDGQTEWGDDGFINEDYRVGGPYMCSLPLTITPLPRRHRLYSPKEKDRIRKKVHDILASVGIKKPTMHIARCTSQVKPEHRPITTLFIHAERENRIDHMWLEASLQIYHFLSDNDMPEVCVEIADPRIYKPYKFAPIQQIPSIWHWDRVIAEITKRIDLTDVITIGCMRVQAPIAPNHVPTVLVTVEMESERDFREMRDIITAILDKYGLPTISVLILRDELVTKAKGPPGFDRTMLDGIARAGGNFGSAKSHLSYGKLGGFVELEFDGTDLDPMILGVTCFHSVRSDKDSHVVSRQKRFAKWDKEGLNLFEEQMKSEISRVEQPPLHDLTLQLQINKKRIATIKNLPKFQSCRYHEANGILHNRPEKEQSSYRVWTQELAELTEFNNEIEEFRPNARLGYVTAYSGNRFLQKTSEWSSNTFNVKMDWALLEILQARISTNQCDCHHEYLHQLTDEEMEDPQATAFWINGTGGPSQGRYNGLKTCLVSEQVVEGGEEDDWVVVAAPRWSFEHTVVGSKDPNVSFSMPGDTGSLIHFWKGGVVGMVSGMLRYSKITFFTHVNDLLADIKAQTGASKVQIMGPPLEEEDADEDDDEGVELDSEPEM